MTELIERYIRSEDVVRAVFSGVHGAATSPWRRVVIRRIMLRGAPRLQFNWYDDRNCRTRNYAPDEPLPLNELSEASFRHAHVDTPTRTIEARVAKRGRLLMTSRAATNDAIEAHDETKQRLITEDAPFLEILGMSRDGVVKPTAQRKYRQINEFARIVHHTLGEDVPPGTRVDVLDLGCGNAYLTFAVHHLLTAVRGTDPRIVGVDRNAETILRNNERARALGAQDRVDFVACSIEDYKPANRPDLLMALHACDTASDDALAMGVRAGAPHLLVSPCCHNDVQRQLRGDVVPAGLAPAVRHGILREQLGDVLTDAARASILGIAGYTVDIFAFVPIEHTARNTMIRAVQRTGSPNAAALADYRAMTSLVPVRPRLAELLAPAVPALAAVAPAEGPDR
jgi:SAM-dependent methyltransferase